MILDTHTHLQTPNPTTAIISCCMKDEPISRQYPYLSAGIHPWFLTSQNLIVQKQWLEEKISSPQVIAIGESGLDRCCQTPFELQMEAFLHCCLLAEQFQLPLFIHSVKAYNEIIAFKKKIKPASPWIIHGFRGKKELAISLLQQGFYLSFGEKYHKEALYATPIDRLLLETDESATDIHSLYYQAAQIRKLTPEVLCNHIQETIKMLFFNP